MSPRSPKAGDFFEAPMGLDNVLVGPSEGRKHQGPPQHLHAPGQRSVPCRRRQHQGLHVHLPRLDVRPRRQPHRRARHRPSFYNDQLDRSEHGLGEVAELDTYQGFVCRNDGPVRAVAPDYLGSTARLGLDLLALRGDIEVVPGIQKFVIHCNWKFTVDNLFDWYHPQITHMSAIGLLAGLSRPASRTAASSTAAVATTPARDGHRYAAAG